MPVEPMRSSTVAGPGLDDRQPAGGSDDRPASGRPEGSHKPPINIEQALGNLGGDQELLEEVVGVFRQTVPSMVRMLREACSTGEADRLEHAAHTLKGAASNVCAEAVRQLAEQLEDMGRRQIFDDAETTLASLERQLAAVDSFAATCFDARSEE